ncbi:MAG: flagellar hook basal-body protein [bacterium]|nr:flagellar hook basal-body protein [bacterium]
MATPIQATGTNMAAMASHYRAITHNLANANTAGFKRQIGSMAQSSDGAQVEGGISIDFDQGKLVRTGRSLDFALEGDNSFFVVETPEGPLYTRNGVFRANSKGQLVDGAGRTVAGQSGPIVIPPSVGVSGVDVSTDGLMTGAGQAIGRIKIVDFTDEEIKKLARTGGVAFKAPDGMKAKDAEKPVVYQRFQEASNVVAVEELVDLITLSRLYEGNFKSIGSQDERMKSIIQVAMG